MTKHKIFSFFSGSGLFDLAFEDQGFDVVFVNEYFEPFADAYKYARKKLKISDPVYGINICSIDDYLRDKLSVLEQNILNARVDQGTIGFIGGPPCPDFSIGGKNKGILGENGKLSKSYCDLITLTKPDWFIFENVKGLLRTKKHRGFYDEMKESLEKSFHLSERLFNSIEAGAPQDRDRIILFGIRKDLSVGADIDWVKDLPYQGRVAIDDYDWAKEEPFQENDRKPKPNNIPIELTVEHWFAKNSVKTHANFGEGFKPKAALIKFQTVPEGDVTRKSSKRLHRWRYSPTAAYGNNEVHLHPYHARRINVAEALALQSMPKDFELPPYMTLTNKFKTIGNGVPYLLGKHIARRVQNFLNQNFSEKV